MECHVRVAAGLLSRLGGLFLLPPDYRGLLLLTPCSSVHTFGMKRDIDIAFVDKDLNILGIQKKVGSGHIVRYRGAYGVLEGYSDFHTLDIDPSTSLMIVECHKSKESAPL